MTSLSDALEALEGKAKGSLSRQSRDCLKLIQAALDLFPGTDNGTYVEVTLEGLPEETELSHGGAPTVYQNGAWTFSVEDTLNNHKATNPPRLDPETARELEAIADDLGDLLEAPVVNWRDLKAALRETVKALGGIDPEGSSYVPPLTIVCDSAGLREGTIMPGSLAREPGMWFEAPGVPGRLYTTRNTETLKQEAANDCLPFPWDRWEPEIGRAHV